MRDFEGKELCAISSKEKQRFSLAKNLLMVNMFLLVKMSLSYVTNKICSSAFTRVGRNGLLRI